VLHPFFAFLLFHPSTAPKTSPRPPKRPQRGPTRVPRVTQRVPRGTREGPADPQDAPSDAKRPLRPGGRRHPVSPLSLPAQSDPTTIGCTSSLNRAFSPTLNTTSAGPKQVLFSLLLRAANLLGPPLVWGTAMVLAFLSFSFFLFFYAFSRFLPTRDPPRDGNNAVFAYSCCIFFWRFLFRVRLPVLAYPHTRAS
jgi:hypothetical protein